MIDIQLILNIKDINISLKFTKMNKYVLLSNKDWHSSLFEKLKSYFYNDEWVLINEEKNFNEKFLMKFMPTKIFIPHWSNLITKAIYENFDCILFHMTDLPYGRGGSPLQNLIVEGHKSTKISALKVSKGIDEGPIYLKRDLSLHGTAKDIFLRSSDIIYEMIISIINNSLIPIEQQGKPTLFKRRKPEQGDISKLNDLSRIYDYIRMLDCEGYPNAFIKFNKIKVEFKNVKKKDNTSLEAYVRIKKT